MKKIIIIGIAIVIGFLGYNMFIKQAKIQKNANMGGTTSIDNTIVIIKDFSFIPQVLNIQSGAEVTFKNDDLVPHMVTFENFDSGTINEGSVYRRTFNDKGAYNYNCAIHPEEKGQIIVE